MKLEIRSNADLHYMFDEDEYFEKNKETRWVSVESLKARLRKETNQPFDDIDFPTFASIIEELIEELEFKGENKR